MLYVRNAHGNYKQPISPYGSKQCAAYGCSEFIVDRAHVRKCDFEGVLLERTVYVIPLCYKHNRSKSDEPIHVKDSTEFIPIN